MRFKHLFSCVLVFVNVSIHSQTKIISSSFSSYNVSPETMCGINISNSSGDISVTVEAKITTIQGTELIKATSNPIVIRNGISNSLQSGLKIANTIYNNTSLSEFVKLYHQLPSGRYNYCVSILLNDGNNDQLCEDIESENSSFLTLVNPVDKDTIETSNPVLIWNHSESFNILQQGEYFRMFVTEIKSGQNAESAINVNSPILMQNFLSRHDVLYPLDAPKLIPGNKYAWQVQKVVNGVITNKTEAWEFVLRGKNAAIKTVVEITPKLNVSPYMVTDGKIYFMFKEEYLSANQKLNGVITDQNGKETQLKHDSKKNSSAVKMTSNNRYEVDLSNLGLQSGIYQLKVMNEKNQDFLLKFQIQ